MKVLIFLTTLLFTLHISSQSYYNKPTQPANLRSHEAKIDYCDVCVQFSGQFINQLLNIILNVGVVGGCGELCTIVEDKTGSEAAGIACNILCDLVGLKAFIDAIEKADLDPIYYCELLKACPIIDNGDASVVSFKITPNPVPRGSEFEVTLIYKTINGTGTGEIAVLILAQDGLPLGQNVLITPQNPGTYTRKWDGKASPDPDCIDQEPPVPCETWIPGNYSMRVDICNGECGSKHPHSQIYDRAAGNFTVVESKK